MYLFIALRENIYKNVFSQALLIFFRLARCFGIESTTISTLFDRSSSEACEVINLFRHRGSGTEVRSQK
jgi:hypothetical protein